MQQCSSAAVHGILSREHGRACKRAVESRAWHVQQVISSRALLTAMIYHQLVVKNDLQPIARPKIRANM